MNYLLWNIVCEYLFTSLFSFSIQWSIKTRRATVVKRKWYYRKSRLIKINYRKWMLTLTNYGIVREVNFCCRASWHIGLDPIPSQFARVHVFPEDEAGKRDSRLRIQPGTYVNPYFFSRKDATTTRRWFIQTSACDFDNFDDPFCHRLCQLATVPYRDRFTTTAVINQPRWILFDVYALLYVLLA